MSEILFTGKQIQHVTCVLCKASRNSNTCILNYFDPKQNKLNESKLLCSVATSEFGNFDKNSEEVLAVCEWLYTDNNFFDNEEFFVRHENYYSRIRNNPL